MVARRLRSRAIEDLDESEIEALARFDVSIMRGLADTEAGRTTRADELFDRLKAKYRERAHREKADPGSSPG